MDKLKRFLDCYISTETCNLRCHYCYIAQKRKFNNKLAEFKHSPQTIRRALSVERLGGKCLINLCAGGETLLAEDVLYIIKELLEEGHYVMVVTNGTLTKRFDQIITFDKKLLKRLFFKFSFHYLELKRINMMNEYFQNIKKVQEAGCSFTVEMTPSDEVIDQIDDIKDICMKNLGTLCHITIARDDRTKGIEVLSKYSLNDYKKIWKTFDSSFFNFKSSIFNVKRKEFCYAGDWSAYINLVSGDMTQCYCGKKLDNIYDNIEKPLNFEAIGRCSLPHCYNGHAFLAIGDIPNLETPTYGELREHRTADKDTANWLQNDMSNFMAQKLKDNNEEYSLVKQKYILTKNFTKRIIKKCINTLR